MVNDELKEYPRKIPKLADGGVPSIFQNCPNYISTSTTSVKRLADKEKENFEAAIIQSIAEQKHIKENSINSLDDVLKHTQKCNEK